MADDSEVGIKITAQSKDAEAGIERVDDKIRHLPIAVQEAMEAFGEMRRTLLEAFAVREIAELVEHVAELGEAAIRSSQMLGISVEKVQELGFAARMVGGSAEGMDMALARLERNMAEAGNSSSKASQAFEALGISADEIKNKSPDQVIGLIADKFADAKDGADKTAIAMDLMGRSGAQMIPLLNQGSEGLEKMGLIAKDTGSVLTDMQAEGLEKTAQSITTLKASTEGLGIAFVDLNKSGIDTIISGATSLVKLLTDVLNGLRLISEIIEASVIIAFAKMSEEFAIFGITAGKYIDEIKIGFTTLGQVIDDVAHMHFDKAVQDWEVGSKRIVAAEKDAAASIADISQQYVDFKNKVLEATAAVFTFANTESQEAKNQLHAPTGGTQDHSEEKNQIAIEKNNLATQLELDKLALESRKEKDAELVASGKMSKQQQLGDLRDFASQEWQINMKALDDEAALYDADSAEYNALMNKKKIITAQYNNEIGKLNLQSMMEQRKQYDQLFNGIKSAMDGMVSGILQGTQTWHQAMIRFADNIAIKFAQMAANSALDWVKNEVIKTTATTTGVAARTTAEASGAAASALANASASKGIISSDAAKAAAGAYSSVAQIPYVGWILAPAAAAAAFGAVEAFGSGLPSFAVGAWNLDSDMVAQLHQGEMVVPKTFAQGIRDGDGLGSGSGGDTYHITIQAMDSQSFNQFVAKNPGAIVNALSNQQRLGNSAFKQ